MEIIQAEGIRWVMLATFLENRDAVRWHQSNGFWRWGRVTYLCWRERPFWWIQLTKQGRRHRDLLEIV